MKKYFSILVSVLILIQSTCVLALKQVTVMTDSGIVTWAHGPFGNEFTDNIGNKWSFLEKYSIYEDAVHACAKHGARLPSTTEFKTLFNLIENTKQLKEHDVLNFYRNPSLMAFWTDEPGDWNNTMKTFTTSGLDSFGQKGYILSDLHELTGWGEKYTLNKYRSLLSVICIIPAK